MTPKILHVDPVLTDEETDKLEGSFLPNSSMVHPVIDYDADVYCSKSGVLLAKFRKGVLPLKRCESAYKGLKGAAAKTKNRGTAAGHDNEAVKNTVKAQGGINYKIVGSRFYIQWPDGRWSNTSQAVEVSSGIVGYLDRNSRTPYCRETAFLEKHFDKFVTAWPLIKTVSDLYGELCPDHYKAQKELCDETHPEFIIRETVFTTLTVNKTFRTACHKDAGDFEGGMGNLTVLEAGKYKGGYFVIPKWGVGFDVRTRDILFADVHQWHGNTPILPVSSKPFERISLVMYYRKNMIACEAPDIERMNAANNRGG